MLKKISILIILLLGVTHANAGLSLEDDDFSTEQKDCDRLNTAAVGSEQLRAVLIQEITEINSVSGRKVEKLLRANGTNYILARYANALWNYRFLKALNPQTMTFTEINLGAYSTEIESTETENNALYFVMKNRERYHLNGNELVLTS